MEDPQDAEEEEDLPDAVEEEEDPEAVEKKSSEDAHSDALQKPGDWGIPENAVEHRPGTAADTDLELVEEKTPHTAMKPQRWLRLQVQDRWSATRFRGLSLAGQP